MCRDLIGVSAESLPQLRVDIQRLEDVEMPPRIYENSKDPVCLARNVTIADMQLLRSAGVV